MEKTKTVRVCDECGKELGDKSRRIAGAEGFTCIVCGKEFCSAHIGGSLQGTDSMGFDVDTLCPSHYLEVKEYIEGLKPKKPEYKTWASAHYVVVEAPRGEQVGFGMDSSNCVGPIAKAELTREAANAVYEYIRRERD